MDDLVGGRTIELLGGKPQSALRVVGLAGVDGLDHFANTGLQFALHRAVYISPLQTLTVALLCTFRMGHGFRYIGECFGSHGQRGRTQPARGESIILPKTGQFVQRG